jgi:putative membrane protein
MWRRGILAVSVVAVGAAACEKIDRSGQPASVVPVEDTTAVAAPATDPEIAHLLQTSGAIIMRRATLAKGRAESAAVRAFADSVVTAHSLFDAQTIRLLHGTGTIPVNNDRSKALNATANEVYRELNQKSGAAFDSAYIASEAAFHESWLALMDSALLTVVRSPDLRAELERARPMLTAHLESARAHAATTK